MAPLRILSDVTGSRAMLEVPAAAVIPFRECVKPLAIILDKILSSEVVVYSD